VMAGQNETNRSKQGQWGKTLAHHGFRNLEAVGAYMTKSWSCQGQTYWPGATEPWVLLTFTLTNGRKY
jgi:hypothetical protein